jgi:hypothetical protein
MLLKHPFRILQSWIRIMSRLRPWRQGFDSRQGQCYFSLPHVKTGSGAHPPSYPTGTGNSFPEVQRSGMKLTTYIHLVPRLRMRGAILPFPHTSSWRGVYLSIGYVFMAWYTSNLLFTFYVTHFIFWYCLILRHKLFFITEADFGTEFI